VVPALRHVKQIYGFVTHGESLNTRWLYCTWLINWRHS